MKQLDEVLNRLEQILNEEKHLAINAINDTQTAVRLFEIAAEKQQVLSELAEFTREEALERKDRIEEVHRMIKLNQEIILSNLKFIDELFEAIFGTTKTYSAEGKVKSPSDGFINKKA